MRRGHVEGQLLDQPGQAGGLALGQVQHQPRQRRRVDDRVRKRALQAPADEPCIERVVTVLDQDGALGEAEESPARVLELRGADQHGAVDVMAAVRVRVDRRLAVDQGVEEGQGPVQPEALRPELEDQERSVAGGLDVDGDELRVIEPGLQSHLGRVDRDLIPGDGLRRAAGLEEEGLPAHPRARARARFAQAISSSVSARRIRTAAV
jgi:hypothetical protein